MAKIYTAAELKQFDRLTENLSSRDQVTRIAARLEIKKFVDQHGREKCDAMFKVLQDRDASAGRYSPSSRGRTSRWTSRPVLVLSDVRPQEHAKDGLPKSRP